MFLQEKEYITVILPIASAWSCVKKTKIVEKMCCIAKFDITYMYNIEMYNSGSNTFCSVITVNGRSDRIGSECEWMHRCALNT